MQTLPEFKVDGYKNLPYERQEKINICIPTVLTVTLLFIAQRWHDVTGIVYAIAIVIAILATAALVYGAKAQREGRQRADWLETHFVLEPPCVGPDARFLAASPQHPHVYPYMVRSGGKLVPLIPGRFRQGEDGAEYAVFETDAPPPSR